MSVKTYGDSLVFIVIFTRVGETVALPVPVYRQANDNQAEKTKELEQQNEKVQKTRHAIYFCHQSDRSRKKRPAEGNLRP